LPGVATAQSPLLPPPSHLALRGSGLNHVLAPLLRFPGARCRLHRASFVALLGFSAAGAAGPAAARGGASALLCVAVVLRASVATRSP
jgi:hypothetical protein